MKPTCKIAVASAMLVVAGTAQAAGTITNGAFTVGIGDNGELYDNLSDIGFRRTADGYDPLAVLVKRDSWGVSTILGSAYADYQFFGTSNITGTAFGAFGGASTTALTTTSVGVTVGQTYQFESANGAPNILRIDHVITNTGTAPTNVLFQRNWDLEVAPTDLAENSFWPAGNPTYPPNFVDSTSFGFENPDPAVAYGSPCLNLGCNFIGDLGGGIKIGFANLGSGESVRFSYWYGINDEIYRTVGSGQNVDDLVIQGRGVGAFYQIATQSSDGGIHPGLGSNSAFIGITVPEPATWAMLIAGFGLVGFAARRRRDTAAAS